MSLAVKTKHVTCVLVQVILLLLHYQRSENEDMRFFTLALLFLPLLSVTAELDLHFATDVVWLYVAYKVPDQ
jgi:hypothetical protein